jgi:uncharacterized protein YkwD
LQPINAAIFLITLTASGQAAEQKVGVVFDPDAWQIIFSSDRALAVRMTPAVTPVVVQIDATPIEAPPLPRARPSLRNAVGDNSAALISAFRRQHGEGSVAISPTLTRIAQRQANAMAGRNVLDHDVLAPFSRRISRTRFNRAAENIAYGHADFASTLKQWTNSSGHRANLLLHGAKWVGVAHARNGHRTYWAMVIAGEIKDHIRAVKSVIVRRAAHSP